MAARRRTAEEHPSPNGLAPATNGVGREQLSEIQRVRMLAAMVQEVSQRGAGNVAVAHVVARSGVSRRTFYEIFEDREDCFLAAFDEAVEQIATVILPAYNTPGTWHTRVRSALYALLQFLAQEPDTGRLAIAESLAAGPRALQRRNRVLSHVIAAIDEGRKESKTSPQPPPLTAEGVVGGVLSVLHARLTTQDPQPAQDPEPLMELLNPLMGTIVLPYLGATAAHKEIKQPVPKPPVRSPSPHRDPLHELEMRLTYRTVRVLMALAQQPGCSNRTVADNAGISDQGQVSKLLARLHGLDLIDNALATPARGEPNAWTLTTKGWEIHQAITQRTHED